VTERTPTMLIVLRLQKGQWTKRSISLVNIYEKISDHSNHQLEICSDEKKKLLIEEITQIINSVYPFKQSPQLETDFAQDGWPELLGDWR
jgi:hypothetical protein